MCLLGFQRVCALCALSFLLSSIRLLVFFFIQRNHIEALIFRINTFFKQHTVQRNNLTVGNFEAGTRLLHDRSQDHAHSSSYALSIYQLKPRWHTPFAQAVFQWPHTFNLEGWLEIVYHRSKPHPFLGKRHLCRLTWDTLTQQSP